MSLMHSFDFIMLKIFLFVCDILWAGDVQLSPGDTSIRQYSQRRQEVGVMWQGWVLRPGQNTGWPAARLGHTGWPYCVHNWPLHCPECPVSSSLLSCISYTAVSQNIHWHILISCLTLFENILTLSIKQMSKFSFHDLMLHSHINKITFITEEYVLDVHLLNLFSYPKIFDII